MDKGPRQRHDVFDSGMKYSETQANLRFVEQEKHPISQVLDTAQKSDDNALHEGSKEERKGGKVPPGESAQDGKIPGARRYLKVTEAKKWMDYGGWNFRLSG